MNRVERLKKQQKEAKQQRAKIKEIKADSLIKAFKNTKYGLVSKAKCKRSKLAYGKKSQGKKMLIDILQNKHNASRLDVLIALQGV